MTTIAAPEQTTEAMLPTPQPRVFVKGEELTATYHNTIHTVTVTYVCKWYITTDHCHRWWNHQDGHAQGESVNDPRDHLNII